MALDKEQWTMNMLYADLDIDFCRDSIRPNIESSAFDCNIDIDKRKEFVPGVILDVDWRPCASKSLFSTSDGRDGSGLHICS